MIDVISGFFVFSESLFTQTYFGSNLIQYFLFFLSIIIGWIIGKIVSFIFTKYIHSFAKKTKSNIDDLIVNVVKAPLIWFFPLLAVVFGFRFLTVTDLFIQQTFYNILQILFLFLIAWLLIRLIDGLVLFYIKPLTKKTDTVLDDQIVPVVSKLLKISIISIILIIALSSFGYDVTALIAGLGIGGLAFAFAAKETVADIFGGISIFTGRPFVINDWVNAGSVEGKVEEIGLRYTRIRDAKNRLITIPNSKVAHEAITNFSNAKPKGMDLTLGLTYQTKPEQLKKAIELIKKIINSTEGCKKDPIVVFNNYSPSSLDLFVRYFITNTSNWRNIKHKINMTILEEFNNAGLEFAYPTQTIFLEKS